MNRKGSYRNEAVTAADDEIDDAMLADAETHVWSNSMVGKSELLPSEHHIKIDGSFLASSGSLQRQRAGDNAFLVCHGKSELFSSVHNCFHQAIIDDWLF